MTVLVDRYGAVVVITINRPRVRNAVDRPTALAIAAAVDALDADDDLLVGILTGSGGSFCSGMDLKVFLTAGLGERPAELDGRGFGGITQTPPSKPLIAAVEGYALAGGCEMALACDLIVASETATFGLTEVTRGLVAGAGGMVRLPRKVPKQIAMEYLLTGAHFPAAEAHRWGLVNRLTPPGGALAEARKLAESIAANAPLAVLATKRIVTESADWSLDEAWGLQRSLVDSVLASDDAMEGSQAFTDKRPPVWTRR